MDLWDYESWYELSGRVLQLARDAGALSALPGALTLHAGSRVYAGEFAAAEALIEEEHGLSVAIGCPDVVYSRLILAGWSARHADTAQLIEAGAREAAARGEGRALGAGDYATAVLYNALGRYGDALAASRHAAEHPEDLAFSALVLVELIEAAARSRQPERAAVALERLAVTTRASGTELALGIEARSRALLSAGAEAEDLHREAIDRLGRTRVATYRARAHLQYGEWLRRERRRVDAREQLRTAYEMFAAMGAEGFAARAARELLATGETARRRSAETSGQLTAQEAQIAALARDGLSSPEIAARLFISPRTVEYHLHKIFAKLGITSRRQLAGVLGGEPGRAQPV
jgi:DNA-binding CsgD family transcriptional regulator